MIELPVTGITDMVRDPPLKSGMYKVKVVWFYRLYALVLVIEESLE